MATGAEFVFEAIRAQGVTHVFMDPGGLNDAFMPPMTHTDMLQTVVAAFEGGAAYMADGYARASGTLGVCFGIGGPGVLNMTTALAAAKVDRSSVLAISGEVPRSWQGQEGFQDASQEALNDVAALRPVCGYSESVPDVQVLGAHLRAAMVTAITDRTSAHLSIPLDVQHAEVPDDWQPIPDQLLHPEFLDEAALRQALAALQSCPDGGNVVILAGPGVGEGPGARALQAVAEKYEIPVATTLGGKGCFPDDHPLALGTFGYAGSQWATSAILSDEVDVLLVIGSWLSQRDTLQWDPRMLPSTALIHVDADPTVLGKTWPTAVPVVSNPCTALNWMLECDDETQTSLAAGAGVRSQFLARIKSEPRSYGMGDTTSDVQPMHPARVVSELRAAFPDDGVLCVDSGAHRAWFAEYWTVPQIGGHYSLANLAPMGGAVPLSIGAALAEPDRPVMVATGDGCMLMHGMELHTAATTRTPLIVAVMNNHAYGNIWYRAKEMGAGPEGLTTIKGVDWVGFAHAMGAGGERVEDPSEVGPALRRGLSHPGPYLLDLVTDKHYPTPVVPWRERLSHWHDSE